MSNAAFTSNAQECSSTVTGYSIQMPCEGAHQGANIPSDTPTEFAFGVADLNSMTLIEGGALLLTFINGSTLTLENFAEAKNNPANPTITFSDGTVMNMQTLFGALEQDMNNAKPVADILNVVITKPVGAIGETALEFTREDNTNYTLGFGKDDIAKTERDGDTLTITFKDGTTLVLRDFGVDGENPAPMTLADGTVIPADDLITALNTSVIEQIQEVVNVKEIAAVEPAAGQPQKITKTDSAGADVAAIEPAAGEGTQGAIGNTGANFNSEVDSGSIGGLGAIGPIAPTALAFDLPETATENLIIAAPAVDLPPLPPVLTMNDVSGFEDNQINLNIDASPANPGGTENISITITGIPTGWAVIGSGTYNPATGTWTLNVPNGQSYNGGPFFIPPANSDADINDLSVTVTTTDTTTGLTSVTTGTIDVIVDAVADVPNLTAADANGFEDTDIPLNINFSLNDNDGSEELTAVQISGVPAGFTLVGGTDLGGGVWSVPPANINTLSLRGPNGYSGSVPLTITTTVTEVNTTDTETTLANNVSTATTAFNVHFEALADAPSLVVDNPVVKEDGSVDMNISATLNDTDGSETLTVTVTGIDTTWTINNATGTYNPATGTWTITMPAGQNFSGILNFTPPANSDVDMTNITVSATTVESSNGSTTTASTIVDILTDAVADAPILTTSNVSGQSGASFALNINNTLTDTDGSEILSAVKISGLPVGFSLSAGTDLGGGIWEVGQADLAGLQLLTPAGFNGNISLGVSVSSIEQVTDGEIDLTDNVATVTGTIDVALSTTASPPTVTVNGTHEVYEDGSVYVPFSATLTGLGNEVLTVTVTGIPSTWTIATGAGNGTYNAGTGTWTITLPASQNYNGGLTFTPPANSDIDLSGLQVTASALDTASNTTASTSANTTILVDAVADAPTLTANDAAGTSGSSILLNISNALTDTDGSETLGKVTISGVPAGFTLNKGTDLGGGVWELTQAQLNGLAINTPANVAANFSLTVSVTSTEGVTDSDFDLTNNTATTTTTLDVDVTDNANPPTITVAGSHQVLEDGSILVPFSVALNGSVNEVLTVTLSGVPSTWTVTTGAGNGTYNPATGTWTITLPAGQSYNGGLTFAPPANSDVDLSGLQISASAFEPSSSTTATANATTGIIVDAVADAPTLNTTNASGSEGAAIDLNISTALTDTDGSEVLGKIKISGLPAGFSLNKGTDLGGGVWEVTKAQLSGLKLNTPNGFFGNVPLTVSVTSTEQVTDTDFNLTNNTATTTKILNVTINDTANPPTLNVDGTHQVLEDGSVYVPFSATLNGSANEVLTVTVAGIPSTWTITTGAGNGTYNAATGTWTITLPAGQNYNGGLTFAPPANSDIDLSGLQVTANAYVPATNTNSSVSEVVRIVVDAVADAPTLTASNVAGEAGDQIALNIGAALTDTDGSETLSKVTISGLPAGFSLSAGTNLGGGVWEVTKAQLTGLKLNTPAGYDGNFSLGVSVTSTEGVTDGEFNLTNNTATTTGTFNVVVTDPVSPPTLTVAGTHQVLEDGSIVVPIAATLNGGAGQVLTVTVTGIDSSWTIATGAGNGTYNAATGTWTITLPAGTNYNGGLTFTPPADSDVDMTGISVTATASKNGQTETTTKATQVIVDAVADAPTLTAANANGNSNTAVALNINAALKDTDGSETLGKIKISGLPAGFSLSAGTNLGGGVWEVTKAQLTGLKLNVPNNYSGNVSLGLSVTTTEGVTDTDFNLTNNTATTTTSLTVAITDLPNTPTLNVAGVHQVKEDGTVFLPIEATLNGSSREVLTVTVTGIGANWTVTAGTGTYNAATGTWTITLPAGTNYNGGLSLKPPANSDVDLTSINVTASAYEPSSGTSATATANTSVVVDAVADAPTLTVINAGSLEGVSANLSISTAVTDTDGSESITKIQISGLPAGFSLNKGTDLGSGIWELTPAQLSGLKLNPPATYYGTVDLTVTSFVKDTPSDTEFDTSDNTASVSKNLRVTFSDLPNPPTLDVDGVHKVYEDGSVFVPVGATLNGSPNEVLIVTITGINPSWSIVTGAGNGTYNAATGTWTITLPAGQNYNGGITFKPPVNSDIDLTGLQVTAQAYLPSANQSSSVSETIRIIVDAVADAPTLTTANANGEAGTAIALNIGAALTDTDGSEVLGKIKISGLPNGFSLSAGTNLGGGVWEVTKAQLTGLKLNTVDGYQGNVNLTVAVTSTEQVTDNDFDLTNNTATTTKTLVVSVSDPVEPPTLNVAGEHRVLEDGSVLLPISATLNGANEVLSIKLTGIPSTWTVTTGASNGTYNAATGTWTITLPAGQNYNGGITVKPPANSDVDLTGITVTATATKNGTTATDTEVTKVIVDAVADAPTLTAANATGTEGTQIALNISTAVTDTDGSESITKVVISGLPAGFSLNKGTSLGNGEWQLTTAQLTGLKLITPANSNGTYSLTVKSYVKDTPTDTDYITTNNEAVTTKTLSVTVNDTPVTPPTLIVAGEHRVLEDGSVHLPIKASLNGTDGQETLSIKLTGIPSSWTVTVGSANGSYNAATGTWTITLPKNTNYDGGITVKPPANSDVDLTGITVTATATKNGTTATDTEVTKVIVDAVADAPTLTAANATGTEGTQIALNIATAVTDTDGSESITKVVISGLPSGFSLSAGTSLGGGSWQLTTAQLTGLKLITPANSNGTYSLTVKSYAYDTPTDTDYITTNNEAVTTKTLSVTVNDTPVTTPTLDVAGEHRVLEDGSVLLPIKATLNGTDGQEVLSIKLTGIPSTWTVTTGASNGTYNAATGTWTITLPKGQNYNGGITVKPPANSDVDLTGITVTATATKNGTTATDTEVTKVIVDAVADAPTLNTANATGTAGDGIPLNISAALTDTDGSEVLSKIKISGMPSGYTLSAGTNLGGGVWELTSAQLTNLKINAPQNASGAVNLTVSVTSTEQVTDTDYITTNNTATTTKTLKVTVNPDSIPVFDPVGTVTVDETDLKNGTVSVNGRVTANFGVDALGAYSIPTGGRFTASGSVAGAALTSGGVAVAVTISGNKYIGKAGSITVFELTMNADGTYSFKQFKPLDHGDINNSNETIHLNFEIKVTDNDGDSATTTLKVGVQDDGIVAVDDWVCIPTCDAYVNGNVLTGGNPSVGNEADNLSVDVANTLIGVHDRWGNYHELVPGQYAAIEGKYGKLYIASDGTYSYEVLNWGTMFDLDPKASDFTVSKPSLTRDGITITVKDPLYGGQSKGQLTWTNNGIGITGNGDNKINPGEVIHTTFAGSGVYNASFLLAGISAGTKIIDYCVLVRLCDGTTQTIFGQKAIPVVGGEALLTLDTWNDFDGAVSILNVQLYSENTTPFSFVLKDVSAQEHLFDTFEYVVQDGDGDTDMGSLNLSANAEDVTFNTSTIYVGATRTDPGDGVADGTNGNDLILGWTLNDTLRGNDGDDTLAGWSGNDTLYGGNGDDVLLGEAGSDILYGGAGADIFVVDGSDGGTVYDRIMDFNAAEGDVIDLSALIDGFNTTTDDIADYVRVVNSGGKAMLQVNSDGAGGDWKNAILINNKASTAVNVEELFQNGNIDVT